MMDKSGQDLIDAGLHDLADGVESIRGRSAPASSTSVPDRDGGRRRSREQDRTGDDERDV